MSDQNAEPHVDIWGLLRAELSTDDMLVVAAHLDDCVECRDELVEDALGHALLQRSATTLRGATPVAGDRSEAKAPFPAPADLAQGGLGHEVLPPLRVDTRPRQRTWVRPLVAVAAVAALMAGTAGITRELTRAPDTGVAVPTPTPAPTQAGAVQQARLQPLEGNGRGEVTMASREDDANDVEMTINVQDLPQARRGQFYYAWLLEPDTNKMLPLGVLGRSGKATFEVPASVLGRYRMIDVSLETDDGDPQHSVTSVLRGAYA